MRETGGKNNGKGAALVGGLLFSALLLLVLVGCASELLPRPREVETLALMRTMGVDRGAAGGVTVTVSDGAGLMGDVPPMVLSTEASTISGACLALQRQGRDYVFFGHVGQLLLGEALSAQGVDEALRYVERDIEMRLDTQLFVVRAATAGEAIGATTTATLDAFRESAGLMDAFAPRTVKDALGGLAQNGATFVPALAVGEEGALSSVGYAIIKEGVLAGWAEGTAAKGVNLLLKGEHTDVLELPGEIALRLVGAKTTVAARLEGETVVGLTITCRVEANVAQAPQEQDLTDPHRRERLKVALETAVQERLRAAVQLAQGLDADFLGLKKRAGLAAPWHWNSLQEQWGGCFSTLPVTVTVEGIIQRSYDIKG